MNRESLAEWYRGFSERAGNSKIWAARLRTAEELETEADSLEAAQVGTLSAET
jgi:hypothetical protein